MPAELSDIKIFLNVLDGLPRRYDAELAPLWLTLVATAKKRGAPLHNMGAFLQWCHGVKTTVSRQDYPMTPEGYAAFQRDLETIRSCGGVEVGNPAGVDVLRAYEALLKKAGFFENCPRNQARNYGPSRVNHLRQRGKHTPAWAAGS